MAGIFVDSKKIVIRDHDSAKMAGMGEESNYMKKVRLDSVSGGSDQIRPTPTILRSRSVYFKRAFSAASFVLKAFDNRTIWPSLNS